MLKGMTKWLGVVDNTKEEETVSVNAEGEEKPVEKQPIPEDEKSPAAEGEGQENPENDDLISPETKQTLEDVSAKAINTAKEWGSYLYTFGMQASEKVSEKAKEISKTMEDKTFLGEFSREQDKFVTEKKEKEKKSEAAVPPWVGYNEEESMKTQILALSQDKRNFLRNPPAGIQYQFDFDAVFPIAMATLQEDENLRKMRFELVPKQVKEDLFWRNYFYRVSLIKQSTQLTSLAQKADAKSGDHSRESSSSSENRDKSSPKPIRKDEEEEIVAGSPSQDEFVSDAFQADELTDEDLKKEMEMLGMDDTAQKQEGKVADLPQWEQELQRELQEYEVVNEGGDIDDADIENEILKQIEEESKPQ